MIKEEKNPEQGIVFVQIPGEVAFNKKLNKTDTFVFWIIRTLDCTEKHCWASNEFMAERLDISTQTVSNSIAKLKKEEYVTQISFDGRRRVLTINNNYHEKYRNLVEKYNTNEKRLKEASDSAYKKSYKQPIRSLIGDKDSYNNSDRRRLSKESLTDSSESEQGLLTSQTKNDLQELESKQIPPTSLQYNLLDFWNNLPNIPTKHTRFNTKVRLTAAKYFTQLAYGRFGNDKKFKPGFFNDHNLSSSILTKRWTREEIKEGLKLLNNIFISGYWPRGKDGLPTDLATLLYNPGNQNSWFLMVTGRAPELIDNSKNFNPKNHKATKQYPDIIEPIIKQFQDKQVFNHDITAKTMDEILSVIEYHSRMDFSNQMAKYRWGNLKLLIDDFCNFIISKSWLENSIINISAEGKIFQSFIDDCEEELYNRVRLRPKE